MVRERLTAAIRARRSREDAKATLANRPDKEVVMLADSYGRVATDLRVSLTDRCNLRCSYCMPPEGLEWLPGPDLLTAEEICRLVAIGVERLGITQVRYTG